MTSELKAAAERIARIKAGERQRVVYDFSDEVMDDFMYRMLENRYVADLKAMADELLARLAADEQRERDVPELLRAVAKIPHDAEAATLVEQYIMCGPKNATMFLRERNAADEEREFERSRLLSLLREVLACGVSYEAKAHVELQVHRTLLADILTALQDAGKVET